MLGVKEKQILTGGLTEQDVIRMLATARQTGCGMPLDRMRAMVAAVGPDHITKILTQNITAELREIYWTWPDDWKLWVETGETDYLDQQVIEQIPQMDQVPLLSESGDSFQEIKLRNANEITYRMDGAGGILSIDLRARRSDRLDYFANVGKRMGRATASKLHTWLYVTMLRANPTCYDLNSLFDDTNHGNDFDPTNTGKVLNYDNLRALIRKADAMTDDSGEPIGSDMFYLVCGRYNWEPAEQMFTDQEQPGTANRNRNIVRSRIQQVIFSRKLGFDYYLLMDPKEVPGLHVDFFEGRQEPNVTAEQADSSFQFENPGHQRWRVDLYWGGTWIYPQSTLRGSQNTEPS